MLYVYTVYSKKVGPRGGGEHIYIYIYINEQIIIMIIMIMIILIMTIITQLMII